MGDILITLIYVLGRHDGDIAILENLFCMVENLFVLLYCFFSRLRNVALAADMHSAVCVVRPSGFAGPQQ